MTLFPGFTRTRVATQGAEINLVHGGAGPPVLLLHGYPQTHVMWHAVAPRLAKHFTVVAADLRGYGDSSKPESAPDHAAYSKRAMAADQVEAMASLGFDRFFVVGHDRGARVAFRMALDHPEHVAKLALLDIIPTAKVWALMDKRLAQSTYHWLFLAQPADLPERLIGNDVEFFLRWTLNSWAAKPDWWTKEAFAEYLRCFRDPATIHGTCEDYRAGATIDLVHDDADGKRKLDCPLLVLWGAAGKNARHFDFLSIWRQRAGDVRGGGIECGHFLPEEAPDETYAALREFLAAP
jgi:haloacetate dehalogenase